MEDYDESGPRRVKLLELLDCESGRLRDPESGPPVAVLVFSHKWEVEEPFILPISDVRRLAAKCLTILSEFDDEVAARIVRDYVAIGRHGSPILLGDGPTTAEAPEISAPPAPEISAPAAPASDRQKSAARRSAKPNPKVLDSWGLTLSVSSEGRVEPLRFSVLTGYKDADDIFLIMRTHDLGESPIELIAQVVGRHSIKLRVQRENMLPPSWWLPFARIPVGHGLELRGRTWKRIGRGELRRIVGRRPFTISK